MTREADRLAFDYSVWTAHAGGERLTQDEAARLRPADHRRIVAAAGAFQRLLEKTIRLCRERPELLDYFRFHPDLLDMFRAARLDEPIVARFDFFLCQEGLQVSEFNTDVCAGINETQGLYDVFLGRGDLFDATRNLVELLLPPKGGTVGFMYPTGYSDDFEPVNYLRIVLDRLGVRTVYGAPVNFQFDGRRLSAFGKPVDVLYRYYLAEWLQELPNLGDLLAAYRAGAFRMVTGFAQVVCQTKKVMAFWYDHPELLGPAERRLLEAHVPRTRLYADLGRKRAQRMRRHVVVKRGFGNMGNEVIVGPLLDRDEFAELLDRVDEEPDEWVVQDFFEVKPDAGGMYPCFGAYMIDGNFSGYYTRRAPEPFICYTARVAATDYEA